MNRVADMIEEAGITLDQLADSSKIDKRFLRLLLAGSYTPSPSERARIAEVLGASIDDIAWDHTIPVQHMRGNGPQTGRAT